MSVLRVQQITDESGTGAVEFTKGVTFSQFQDFDDENILINTTGIVTTNQLNVDNLNIVGVITATSFFGSGKQITNPPGTPIGLVIGQHLIT